MIQGHLEGQNARKRVRTVCGKRFTFLYTSPYEHVQYIVSGP